jgi:signal transduction histidine kinase
MRLRMPPGVKLILEKAESKCVFGMDPVRLLQLITNLSNNAIKHTKEGSITIGYKVLPEDRLEFYVKDTGLGIPKEKQKQLFGRFAKVNDYAEGIGLGLAICQGLVTKMGGTISVKSEHGAGSEFIFSLPSHEPTEA